MAGKRSPFNKSIPNRGAVVAVQLENGRWCYAREYVLCHGFLPFFSVEPLAADRLPTLEAALFFDLWCYDSEETPMVFVGTFPFETEEESFGEPCYTAPDEIDCRYRIHEMVGGIAGMRKTTDEAEVAGMRLQRRYQPFEFSEFLSGKTEDWPVVKPDGTSEVPNKPPEDQIISEPVFLEIIFKNADFPFAGRDVVEDPLSDALEHAGIGEVTGGGGGSETSNIDVELANLERGLEVIRRTLRELGCPESTEIRQYQPQRVIHRL